MKMKSKIRQVNSHQNTITLNFNEYNDFFLKPEAGGDADLTDDVKDESFHRNSSGDATRDNKIQWNKRRSGKRNSNIEDKL